jgi:uncharacterized protein (DUF934 family)
MTMLLKQGLLIKDPWLYLDQPLDDYRDYPWFSIVPLEGLRDKSQWPLAQTWIGAWFGVGTERHQFTEPLLNLPLLNIKVENFADGRVFSLAKELRANLRYEGELRISGNFMLDQMAHLKNCGVSSFSLPDDSDFEYAQFILQHSPRHDF